MRAKSHHELQNNFLGSTMTLEFGKKVVFASDIFCRKQSGCSAWVTKPGFSITFLFIKEVPLFAILMRNISSNFLP